MGTLRHVVLLGVLGTLALCAVGPLLQWAAGQAVQLVAEGAADLLRSVGWGCAGALIVGAGSAGIVGTILAWGAVGTRRDQAAWELYAAMQRGELPTAPDEIIDGVFTVRHARPGNPARRLPPANRG